MRHRPHCDSQPRPIWRPPRCLRTPHRALLSLLLPRPLACDGADADVAVVTSAPGSAGLAAVQPTPTSPPFCLLLHLSSPLNPFRRAAPYSASPALGLRRSPLSAQASAMAPALGPHPSSNRATISPTFSSWPSALGTTSQTASQVHSAPPAVAPFRLPTFGYTICRTTKSLASPGREAIPVNLFNVQVQPKGSMTTSVMSSQDSIGTVLKCMQKGAVDFLVKPVRKNELRNLWQHVWRRHSMNCQTNGSENNAASNHISANVANGSKTGENSDEESDGQSFGSKREAEIQSVEKLPEIRRDEVGSSKKIEPQNKSYHDGVNTKVDASKDSDGAPSGSDKNVRPKCLNGITSAKVAEQIMDNALRTMDTSSRRPSNFGKDLGMTEPAADRKRQSSVMENNPVTKGAAIGPSNSSPSQFLETNVGKQHHVNGYKNQEFKDKDIFNHSNSSAFSRYGNKRIEPSGVIQFFPSVCITGQDHVHGKDPVFQPSGVLLPPNEHNTGESTRQVQITLDSSTEGAAIMCSSSAREDAGVSSSSHRRDNMSHPSYGFIPVPIPVGPGMPYHYGAILQPVYYPHGPLMHCDSTGINKAAIQHASGQSNYHEAPGKPSQVDEHKQSEKNHQLHHSRQILRESLEPIDMARAHMDRANQSASCSQDICKASGCTGSGEADINANTMVALESGNESGIQNGDRSRREAALMKFRMKRKDRCFEKKVRYHSRKKLAEQRPRVKGQFVSQKLQSATTTEAETDS